MAHVGASLSQGFAHLIDASKEVDAVLEVWLTDNWPVWIAEFEDMIAKRCELDSEKLTFDSSSLLGLCSDRNTFSQRPLLQARGHSGRDFEFLHDRL